MHLHIGMLAIPTSQLVIVLAWVAAVTYAVAALVNANGRKDLAIIMLLVAAFTPWQFLLVAAAVNVRRHLLIVPEMSSVVFQVLAVLPLIAAFWLALRRFHREG